MGAVLVMGAKSAESKEIFETLPVPKALKAMAVPTIFSQIIVLIYNLADTFYVGRTNNPYMVAAASLILPVFNITIALAGLTGIGGGSLMARLLGEKQEDEAKKVCGFSFYNRHLKGSRVRHYNGRADKHCAGPALYVCFSAQGI